MSSTRDVRRSPWLWLSIAALASSLALGACGDDGGKGSADTSVTDTTDASADAADTALPTGPSVRFDLDGAQAGDFFAFPFPSDLRVTSTGAPDFTHFPDRANPVLAPLITELEETTPGVSPNGGVFFTFEADIDTSSLPALPEKSVLDDAAAYIVNVEPGSPQYGKRLVTTVHYTPDAHPFNPAFSLLLRATPGFPMRGGERHIAVLTRDLRLATGEPVGAVDAWESIRGSVFPPAGVSPELHAHVREVIAALSDAGEEVDNVLVASAFTTFDPTAPLDGIRAAVEALPYTLPGDLTNSAQEQWYWLYEGAFEVTQYMQGVAPYTNPGEGRIHFGSDGLPIATGTTNVRYAFAYPVPEAPPEQIPRVHLVINAHGVGGDALSFVPREGKLLTDGGMGVISMDGPLHGERNPTAMSSNDLYIELATNNMLATRDLLLQYVADQLQLMRMIEALKLNDVQSPYGIPLDLVTDPSVVMGHGFGGQAAALLMAVEPRIDSAVLSETGGSMGISLLRRSVGSTDIEGLLRPLLGLDADEVLDESHPIVALIAQPLMDPVDPLNFAHRYFKEPIGTPKDILMTLATKDTYTLPETIVSLAVAAGVPPVAPLQQPSPLWAPAGLIPQDAPVQGNITVTGATDCGDRDPCVVTAGLISYPLFHTLIYESMDVQVRYANFIAGAFLGVPSIIREN